MQLVVATTVGLGLWVVLWALNVKSFDAFLITVAIVVIAAGVQVAQRFRPGRRR